MDYVHGVEGCDGTGNAARGLPRDRYDVWTRNCVLAGAILSSRQSAGAVRPIKEACFAWAAAIPFGSRYATALD